MNKLVYTIVMVLLAGCGIQTDCVKGSPGRFVGKSEVVKNSCKEYLPERPNEFTLTIENGSIIRECGDHWVGSESDSGTIDGHGWCESITDYLVRPSSYGYKATILFEIMCLDYYYCSSELLIKFR